MAGQIVQRGGSAWLVRVYVGRRADGSREYRSRTIKGSRKAAERALTKMLREKDTGQLVVPTRETLAAYLKRWLDLSAKPRVRERTLRDYGQLIHRHIVPVVGSVRLDRLTPLHIQGVYAGMREKGLSERSVQYVHTVLRSALKQAVRWRLLVSNPGDGVDAPRVEKKEREWLSPDEARTFLASVQPDRFYALWAMLLLTGMRPGEALALRWSDITDDGCAQIRRALVCRSGLGKRFEKPKTPRSERTIPLGKLVLGALKAHRKVQAQERLEAGSAYEDGGLVFATRLGKPLDTSRISVRFKRLLKNVVARDGVRLYDLRHTHASLLLAKGVHLKVISERLGHSTITLTADTYGHVMPELQQHATEQMEALVG
jgi:integrase